MSIVEENYIALVKQTEDGKLVSRRVEEAPSTLDEHKVKVKARKLELDTSKAALKQKKAEDKETNPKAARGFKRPSWPAADKMTCYLSGSAQKVTLAVEVEDTWLSVKEDACVQLSVDPKDYELFLRSSLDGQSKKKRGKDVPKVVGESCLFDGDLVLCKKKVQPQPADSSSSSSSS